MLPPLGLAVAAVKDAVADAGLTLDDIDGLSTYPGGGTDGGFGEGGVTALEDALGLRPTWYNGGAETFGPSGSVIAAMLAVAVGPARHVVCFPTGWQGPLAARPGARGLRGGRPHGHVWGAAGGPGPGASAPGGGGSGPH